MYSAKKIGGKKLYELARQGKKIKRQPNKIIIHDIELIDYDWPRLVIKISCSSGTYIRSLAHDIGQNLDCGAYLEELERTRIGKTTLDESISLSKINKKNWEKFIK